MIKHLHCLFFVINENEPTLIMGSKLPFLMRRWIGTNGSLTERMPNWINVLIFFWSSRDLTFPDKTLRGVRGEKWQLKKTFGFFSTNYFLTKRFPFVFHRLFHSSKDQQLVIVNSHGWFQTKLQDTKFMLIFVKHS